MAVDKRNVKRLVTAAWRGVAEELAIENSSAEDVINAAINIASDGIRMAMDPKHMSHDQILANALSVRNALQLLILDTIVDEGKLQ